MDINISVIKPENNKDDNRSYHSTIKIDLNTDLCFSDIYDQIKEENDYMNVIIIIILYSLLFFKFLIKIIV